MIRSQRTDYNPQRAARLLGLPDPTAIIDPERLTRAARRILVEFRM